MEGPIIAVDFDGTLCDHRFPQIGDEVDGAFKWLQYFRAAGCRLILWTMRDDTRGDHSKPLSAAVEWCRERGVEFWGINENPEQKSWTDSPKVYAHIYIDDAAAGVPLKNGPLQGSRLVVDWEKVGPIVCQKLSLPALVPVN